MKFFHGDLDLLAFFNPLSTVVLDPDNYPGGRGRELSGPTVIFWLFVFLCPLVSMFTQILDKGVFTDHVEKNSKFF